LLLKQDRPIRHNVTLRRFRATIFAVDCITHSECCNLSYPACNAHEPYCHLRPKYFPTLSHKRHDFRKIVFEHKCVL